MTKKRIVAIIEIDDPQDLVSDANNMSDASALIEVKLAMPGVKFEVTSYSSVENLIEDYNAGLIQPTSEPWDKDSIQFPRLICEIVATQDIDMGALEDSMSLNKDQLAELFERANISWEAQKSASMHQKIQ